MIFLYRVSNTDRQKSLRRLIRLPPSPFAVPTWLSRRTPGLFRSLTCSQQHSECCKKIRLQIDSLKSCSNCIEGGELDIKPSNPCRAPIPAHPAHSTGFGLVIPAGRIRSGETIFGVDAPPVISWKTACQLLCAAHVMPFPADPPHAKRHGCTRSSAG